ncbi:Ras guanyl-releasing protein 3 [Papilio xuthus]|uniref:Ras guanyl-releasing protein 3 n=1 Tax=Papilio xuthus TaxID=66420 RepID=A0A194Q392_PAPXU|nr:Ras guanyl-releasing protein 3 [Papilio xuthus]
MAQAAPAPHRTHSFAKKTFHKPTYCHHCSDLLWGLIGQGYGCEGTPRMRDARIDSAARRHDQRYATCRAWPLPPPRGNHHDDPPTPKPTPSNPLEALE